MIGIDVANTTSTKRDENKADASREMYVTIDLEK